MLKLSLIEVLLRGIPEGFLIIFAVYAFSKTVINIKRYIITSIISIISIYLIRLLPIQYGVHTILNTMLILLLAVSVNKIDIIKSIQASLMTLLLEFVCEGINMLIIKYIFKVDILYVLSEPSLKVIYSIPSLLIFAAIVCTYYFSLARRKKLREVVSGEVIE